MANGIYFDKPELNRKTSEENVALIDTWIAMTADKLNYLLKMIKSGSEESSETASGVTAEEESENTTYIGDSVEVSLINWEG